MRSEHTRCWNDRTRKKSVTDRSLARSLCPGMSGLEPSGCRPETVCGLVAIQKINARARSAQWKDVLS